MAYNENINLFVTTDRNNADVFNTPLEKIIENIEDTRAYLNRLQAELDQLELTLQSDYTNTEQLNDILANGIKGDKGDPGEGLAYNWNGTALGVKLVSEPNFIYTELKGDPGDVSTEQLEEALTDYPTLEYLEEALQDYATNITGLTNTVNALRTETGKKMNAVTSYLNYPSGDLLNTTISPLVLCAISSTNNASLYAILNDNFAYVMTCFYSSISETSNRFQIAVGYTKDKMAFRRYKDGWGNWTELITPTMLQSELNSFATYSDLVSVQTDIKDNIKPAISTNTTNITTNTTNITNLTTKVNSNIVKTSGKTAKFSSQSAFSPALSSCIIGNNTVGGVWTFTGYITYNISNAPSVGSSILSINQQMTQYEDVTIICPCMTANNAYITLKVSGGTLYYQSYTGSAPTSGSRYFVSAAIPVSSTSFLS